MDTTLNAILHCLFKLIVKSGGACMQVGVGGVCAYVVYVVYGGGRWSMEVHVDTCAWGPYVCGHVCACELCGLISYVWWTPADVVKVPGPDALPNVSNLGYHCRDCNGFDVKLWSVAEWASP